MPGSDNSNKPAAIDSLLNIMASLRDPQQGCPWDLKQTFQSIAPYTLEETCELIECIENSDFVELESELGDVLFQVVFYAQLGKEQGLFDFNSVVEKISEKLIRRHPHVFNSKQQSVSTEQVGKNWELIKQQEREHKNQQSLLDDIPLALTALQRAKKLQKRASNIDFDWSSVDGVVDKLKEELSELEDAIAGDKQAEVDEELGDMFFTLVNLARKYNRDPEFLLRQANRKFERRFRDMEALAGGAEPLAKLDSNSREELWRRVKAGTKS